MSSNTVRERLMHGAPNANAGIFKQVETSNSHPSGPVKHGFAKQAFLIISFVVYFAVTCVSIHIAQLLGAWLYFVNKDYYYKYMSLTKQGFGLMINSVTHWFNPTIIRLSGDATVEEQLRLTKDGRLKCDFPDRLILMANHQIYTDWLYLWWISYTARMHGHIYIILKNSLKYIPVIGPGMLFFRFIFLARNWAKDKLTFQYHLTQLNSQHHGPTLDSQSLYPMWLLIFPEGTNLSSNGRNNSKKWADKVGLADLQHELLPRSTGLQFCIQELRETVDWLYDCTIAYEGVPRGEFGQDIYTLKATYFEGRAPRSVNMYWRRFAVSTIPVDDPKAFDAWLMERWREKDQLIEQYVRTGRFPANGTEASNGKQNGKQNGGHIEMRSSRLDFLETEVRSASRFEFLLTFTALFVLGISVTIIYIVREWFHDHGLASP